ncbi:mitochondrial genome maintenance protein mgm101 [Pyronema omphalodes]|nr:mitochondrial genome maintenance protein mgm101 [Pyronema omphalodes]
MQQRVQKEKPAKDPNTATENDDEPDEWDKRINKTGCAEESDKLNDCFHDKKDWRLCKDEVRSVDWSKSFDGLSREPFEQRIQDILMEPVNPDDIEMKSDGIIYLPEIKYRRILNRAFGPGGWGLAPRGETIVTERLVTREYALVCHGRLVGIARGEQQYFNPDGIPTATEGCKSNALMRCCKDLGIASELWDPKFVRNFKKTHCVHEFVEHATTKAKKKLWRLKSESWEYPYKPASSFDTQRNPSSFSQAQVLLNY